MKTEIFYARKLYMGKVSVQSSVVSYCKRLGRKLIIDYGGQRMLVHNLDDYTTDGQSFMARYSDKYIKSGNNYQLYDYQWLPSEQRHEEEQTSLEGRLAMLKAWKEMKKNLTEQKKI